MLLCVQSLLFFHLRSSCRSWNLFSTSLSCLSTFDFYHDTNYTDTIFPYRLVSPSDDDIFEKFSKKHGIEAEYEVLSDGTTAYWVGNKNAENIILQFHGGGFNLPISEPCLDYMWRIKESLTKKGTDIAMLNLAYGLFSSNYYQIIPHYYTRHTTYYNARLTNSQTSSLLQNTPDNFDKPPWSSSTS